MLLRCFGRIFLMKLTTNQHKRLKKAAGRPQQPSNKNNKKRINSFSAHHRQPRKEGEEANIHARFSHVPLQCFRSTKFHSGSSTITPRLTCLGEGALEEA